VTLKRSWRGAFSFTVVAAKPAGPIFSVLTYGNIFIATLGDQ
jgi:hypothetical protein